MTPLLRALMPRTIRPRRISGRSAARRVARHVLARLPRRPHRPDRAGAARLVRAARAARGRPGSTSARTTATPRSRSAGSSVRGAASSRSSRCRRPLAASTRGARSTICSQVAVVPLGLGSVDTHRIQAPGADERHGRLDACAGRLVIVVRERRHRAIRLAVAGDQRRERHDSRRQDRRAGNGARDARAACATRSRAGVPRIVLELHAGVSREAVLSLLRELGYSSEAVAIEPVRGERTPQFLDNHSYAFHPA